MADINTRSERRSLPRARAGSRVRAREAFMRRRQTNNRTQITDIITRPAFGNSEEKVKQFRNLKIRERLSGLTDSNISNINDINNLVVNQNDLIRQIIDELKNKSESSGPLIPGAGGGRPKPRTRPSRLSSQTRNRLARREQFRKIGARAGIFARDAIRAGRQTATRLYSTVERGRQAVTSLRERFATAQRRQTTRPRIEPELPTTPKTPTPQVDAIRVPLAPTERQIVNIPRREPILTIPSTPDIPETPRPPVVPTQPAIPTDIEIPRPPAPITPEAPRPSVLPTPSTGRRVGGMAMSVVRIVDRVLAPTIFLDIERALRDLGDQGEYLPVQKLQTFRNTLTAAQRNVELYNELVRSFNQEQDQAKREELQTDMQFIRQQIVGQRNRLLQLVTVLDAEAQQQYQRRIRLAQDQGRTTVGERLVRIAPILSYVLGDERDTSLEAIRRPTDFRALIDRAMTGAPLNEATPTDQNQSPTENLANPASYNPVSTNDASPVNENNNTVLPNQENILNFIANNEFNELKFESDKIKFDGILKETNAEQRNRNSYEIAAGMQTEATQQADATPVNEPVTTPTMQQTQATDGESKSEAAGGQQFIQQTDDVGQTLAIEGTDMMAADQIQARAGQQVVVVSNNIQTPAAQQSVIRSTMHGGEVPLNRRFQNQIAA